MYESPIKIISEDILKDIVEKQDGVLLEIVHRVGFDVNKEELEKALLYDRNQWERGYIDGKMDGYHLRDDEIVRCKDCVHLELLNSEFYYARCNWHGRLFPSFGKPDTRDWFCADGERRADAVH